MNMVLTSRVWPVQVSDLFDQWSNSLTSVKGFAIKSRIPANSSPLSFYECLGKY